MTSTEKTLSSTNDWAKFWYYDIGVNVIPANTRVKKPMFGWKQLQNSPLPDGGFQRWLDQDAFKNGLSIIPGRVWHRPERRGQYLVFIDFDKQRGIDEVLTREDGLTITLQQAANKWIIEQHADSPHKAHAYFYSPIPFPNKSPDAILGIEIKGQGEHGLAFCTNSIHKDGTPYEIIGTREPIFLTQVAARELIQHLDQVCVKHGIQYLERVSRLSEQMKSMIRNLRIDTSLKIPEGERHTTLISVANSILFRYSDSEPESKLYEFLEQINQRLCQPGPLPKPEYDSIWKSAVRFAARIKEQEIGEQKEQQTNGTAREKEKEKEKANEKPLPLLPTYKYSRPFLHEAIILGGVPRFISYAPKFDMIIPFEDIKEPSRILRPPNREEYPYLPYEFADEQELAEYLRCAKLETKDSLLGKAKSIARKYNDQDNPILNLLAIDIFWSYFQDKFGTTHYLDIVGDNDTGKSSLGNTYEAVGYRAVNMTSPTAPNVFRTLGTIEPGQCTLVLDEADKIDESVDMMNILKAGYDYNKKVPKTNTNAWKVEWFYAYCLKIIIAEKSLSRFKAKGLLDRALSINTVPGEPELDIKEVTNPQGDQKLEEALNELLDLRKLMLIFRLVHFEDCIVDLDIGIKSRNRELCKPYLRLFYGTDAQEEIEQTFQTFIDVKNAKKGRSIEAILVPVIINLVEEKGVKVATSDTWEFIKANLEGEPYGPDEYRTSDFTLYKNTITKTLEDKFGAEYKHTNKGGSLTFKLDKLQRLFRSYNADIKIKSKLKSDSSDSSDGSKNKATTLESPKPQETIEISQGSTVDNVNISQNHVSKVLQTPQSLPQEPSLPSLPSPIESSNVEDVDKATMLRQYDRLSALARKKSKAAMHVGGNNNDLS